MIRKYTYGKPFQTESVVVDIAAEKGQPDHGNIDLTAGFSYTFGLEDSDIVYGLGEANRGINKRGYKYISNNADNPHHHEDVYSLYASHNFIIVSGAQTFGLYFDYPSTITFDVGYTKCDELHIFCDSADLDIYVITGDSPYDITKQFRKMIGRSYIPPKFAFGFGQSRWGYKTPEDFETVARKYRENHIPIDMVYMDIDYMDSYKDFTINDDFGDFSEYVENLKKDNIRLIPIIDAGVKIEEGYDVYEEGVANNYFCKRADGSDFVAAVWPGYTHFPDVLNPEARRWFGAKYKILTDAGIEGFWNDMNEPAIFFTPEGVGELKKAMKKFIEKDETVDDVWGISGMAAGVGNNPKDYASMYHNVDGEMVRHDKVHNLFGYNMTRAAGEALREISPDERRLLFSRSSYIGMHRYGGVWMGDNKSWWSHILLNIKMLPSMNMCGFLYTGADLGGFGCDTSRDLLLRWLALGVFTPLMRDHSCEGTRNQECYQFEHIEDFRNVIGVRYRLLPYIYSEYMKAALTDDMMFKPLAFEYPDDRIAAHVEDQLMLGNEIMIAPVYTQNAIGRYVYLPENMLLVRFTADGAVEQTEMPAGHHFVEVPLNEVILFVRNGKCIPVVDVAECVADIDKTTMQLIGYKNSSYMLYDDDGYTREYDLEKNCALLFK
ncbi:MAG: TIM-barrel domain-containing protein [Coprococcus eutactus]